MTPSSAPSHMVEKSLELLREYNSPSKTQSVLVEAGEDPPSVYMAVMEAVVIMDAEEAQNRANKNAANITNKIQTLATLLNCPIADLTMVPDEENNLVAYIDPKTGDICGSGESFEEALDNGIATATRWAKPSTTPKQTQQRALDSVTTAYCNAIHTETNIIPTFHDADVALRIAHKDLTNPLKRLLMSTTTIAYAIAYKAILDAF